MSKKNKSADANKIDNWLKAVDDFEGHLGKLKSVFDKKKKDAEEKADEILKKPIKGLSKPEDEEKDKEEVSDEPKKTLEKDQDQDKKNIDSNDLSNDTAE